MLKECCNMIGDVWFMFLSLMCIYLWKYIVGQIALISKDEVLSHFMHVFTDSQTISAAVSVHVAHHCLEAIICEST